MIEVSTIALTIGALLFHSIGLSVGVVAGVAFCIGSIFFVFAPSRLSVYVATSVAVLVVVGALVMWSRQGNTPFEIYGERVIIGEVIATNRKLDRSTIVLRDRQYDIKIQVVIDEVSDLLPGDIVQIKGLVEEPKDFVGNTGRLFEYQKYLESRGVVGVAHNVIILSQERGHSSISRVATIIRYRCAEIISTYVSFPYDGILSGMLLGYQGTIPKSIEGLFRMTGVLHVLVLSGYNITLMAGGIALLLKLFSQRVRLIATFFAIVLLVLVSGSGVSSVRAGIMGAIALLATMALRQYNPLRALVICYIVFFFVSPLMLLYDPGFHLSFLATFFMIAVIPKIEQLFLWIPKTNYINIRELLLLATLMPICMLPYTMYFSGLVSVAALPANILFAVVTPFIMILGIVLVTLSWCLPLATLTGAVLSFLMTLIISTLEYIAQLPVYITPELSAIVVVGIYGLVVIVLFRKEIQLFILHLRNMLLQRTN